MLINFNIVEYFALRLIVMYLCNYITKAWGKNRSYLF